MAMWNRRAKAISLSISLTGMLFFLVMSFAKMGPTCTTTAILCALGAISCAILSISLLTCVFYEVKDSEDIDRDFTIRRARRRGVLAGANVPTHAPPSYPAVVPAIGTIPNGFVGLVTAPPSYDESSVIEDNRVTNHSNAPPAYNISNTPSDSNIASFSPPPFYRPVTPEYTTQTRSIYFPPETTDTVAFSYDSPTTLTRANSARSSHSIPKRFRMRSRRHPGTPRPRHTVLTIDAAETTASSEPSPAHIATVSRRSLPQMIIDCSKAEPTLFTISQDESII